MKNSIGRLLRKYVSNSLVKAELDKIFALIASPESRKEFRRELRKNLAEVRKQYTHDQAKKHAQVLGEVRNELMEDIKKDKPLSPLLPVTPIQKKYTKKHYTWYKAAAVFTLLVAAGVTIYFSTPGTVEMVTYTTVPGQKSSIVLPDGTSIYLNASSKIILPKKFSGSTREIFLTGEAFFEVARDEKRPFIIKSPGIITTVLGTSFNVKAFSNEETEVTVATGKVRIDTSPQNVIQHPQDSSFTGKPGPGVVREGQGEGITQILGAGDQAIFNPETGELSKQPVELEEFLAWKDGIILYKDESLAKVITRLESWYGVRIVVLNDQILECKINGKHKDSSLEEVLKVIQLLLDIDYELKNREVTLKGGNCKE
ncbi:MAG: FecR domain-containing protein [Cytophagales bacterium]|nr:FecR domain-containing protein [Cytophagales bacterium]